MDALTTTITAMPATLVRTRARLCGEAKNAGITPFCITIDRESEAELRDLYGEIGYTIIDDVLSLPERLPGIYRRLTT